MNISVNVPIFSSKTMLWSLRLVTWSQQHGVTIREHLVKYLHIDEVDVDSDTISGRVALHNEVGVAVWGEQRIERHVQADAERHWVADFSQAVGDEPLEQAHDIKVGDIGSAFQFDEQGNYTVQYWEAEDLIVAIKDGEWFGFDFDAYEEPYDVKGYIELLPKII